MGSMERPGDGRDDFERHVDCDANDFTRQINDRMPVLLDRQDQDAWLSGKAGVELLRPAPNDLLRMWPVSKWVNASGRDDDDDAARGRPRKC
jgi:putative SOS response-associated peptidase YedK